MSRIELLTWVICVDVKRCTHWKLTFTMLSSFSFSYHVRCSFIHSFFRSFFSLAAASIQVSVPVFRQNVSSPGISQTINADDNFCWYLLFEIYILSCTTASTTLKSVVFYIRCNDLRCHVLYLISLFILSLTSEFEIFLLTDAPATLRIRPPPMIADPVSPECYNFTYGNWRKQEFYSPNYPGPYLNNTDCVLYLEGRLLQSGFQSLSYKVSFFFRYLFECSKFILYFPEFLKRGGESGRVTGTCFPAFVFNTASKHSLCIPRVHSESEIKILTV